MPFILASGTALAVAPNCDRTDFLANNPTGCTSLTLDGADIVMTGGPALIWTSLTGNVAINTNVIINGENGGQDITNNGPVPQGGPGGDVGGGHLFGTSNPGGSGSPSDGSTPLPESSGSPCSNGGGGGGFYANGEAGKKCATSIEALAQGGVDVVTSGLFDFGGSFRGGFGGGAGAFGTDVAIGTGGGGGGALHIETSGTITIKSGVTISARGGNGGNATINGGGGGAGSGGAVWLVGSAVQLNGSIDTRGGTGGRNNNTGANGGNGSEGRYRIENGPDVTEGHGLSSGGSSSRKLSSDISCGTIGVAKENKNETFQMMTGFMMALMMGAMIKILSRFPKKVLVKSARPN